MEGGRRFESGPKRSLESEKVIKNPEQAIDSDIESARNENKEFRRSLERTGEIARSFEEAEVGSMAGQIKIAWPTSREQATVLVLNPIAEGRGVEGGVFGYKGVYGKAQRRDYNWVLTDEAQSLEELYGVPNLQLIVHPTVDRWAVGRDGLTSSLFGENARELYMGLGFLFLGQEWMYIGMHEAGHLQKGTDENAPWTWANQENARRSRPDKKRIITGESLGQFGILKKPSWDPKVPTIGDLEKYGLVSHFMKGNAHIPKQWEDKSKSIMRKFDGIIERAQDHYSSAFR